MKDKPMQLLAEHARRQRDEAARQQSNVAAEAAGAARTLSLLREFREQKRDRLRQQMRSQVTTVSSLQLHARFAGTLDEAIEKQFQRLDGLNRRLEQARAVTLANQQHLKAIEMLLQRRSDERARQGERAERKSMDELAVQRALRARAGIL